MPCKIIVSVGTSLLSNNLDEITPHGRCLSEQFRRNEMTVNQMADLAFDFQGDKLNSMVGCSISGMEDFSKAFFDIYLSRSAVQENLKNRAYSREKGLPDLLPAELSSLVLYYYRAKRIEESESIELSIRNQAPEPDTVTLLTTDTPDAVYCARMLKEYISRSPLLNPCCEVGELKVIENLDIYDPSKYANENPDAEEIEPGKGLRKLFDYFDTFAQESSPKVLIRTGGYKEFSADLKLAALSYRFKSLYLFERSLNFVETCLDSWPTGGVYEIWKKSNVRSSS
jgi:hypothetical protein